PAQPGAPAWLTEAPPARSFPPTRSQPLGAAERAWNAGASQPRPPTSYPGSQSAPSWPPLSSGPLAPNSPSLPGTDAAGVSGAYPSARNSPPSPGANDRLWMGPTASSNSGRELRASIAPLLRAFVAFDTLGANRILREALTAHTVESICVALLAPALTRLSDLQAKSEITSPEEQFGVNYVRGFLFSVFHQTPERSRAPLVVVGCGPRDLADINALLLAVFWRRAGARVAFLGQDVDADSLVREVERLRPALIALSVSTSQRVRALTRMAKAVEQLPAPRPIFAYCGTAFTRNPELQRKVNGVYLGDDAGVATWHLRRLLNIEVSGR
ncbi:MAG TPA: cobalamin-dependent protein, partial [Ktedonobacterales bacterium]|nr:cobalamin-dependent protein [Ktedonobacterales bacterium]